ncbi:phage portal protein [Microbispora sp. ATCC PTA-5024]|uniref:phage portal protein n=1 Tax=Microbispora sp. ATCC PTA-5024 TaxID=316330 RepID=UPI0003DBF41F|nr:phage portal protein [Microbispora sp. ATCC PTA-5024]ETK36136.1 phage portal protein [Microbispora sp. ATCC PTA-5024]
MATQYEPLSPDWWVRRLHKQLADRQEPLDVLQDYYCGEHPLPFLPEKARGEFRRLLRMARANYMQLVVDAVVGRLQVMGIRMSSAEDEPDDRVWEIWQANRLDADSRLVFSESVKLGTAYMLVEPNKDDPAMPLVTPEHPSQAIVEYQPGSRRKKAAGLKCFLDDWTGNIVATLMLPDRIYPFQAKYSQGQQEIRWEAGEDGPNPLGEVPLVEYANRPQMLEPGTSEIAGVVDIQDRINKTLADRLMAQEYGAFRQKWATGIEIPSDPETGQAVEPYKAAVDRLFLSEDPASRFGDFNATDLTPYLSAMRDDIKDIAAITATPPHYLLGDMVNLSAEALKAAEAGLISKVRDHMLYLGEAIEDTTRLYLKAAGDARPVDYSTEVVWKNPEFRTEGELVDALTKMKTLGVPDEALWERWGASPQEIKRWREIRDQREQDAASRLLGGDLAALTGPKPDAGPNDQQPPPAGPPAAG